MKLIERIENLKEDVREFLAVLRENTWSEKESWVILRIRYEARIATFRKLIKEVGESGNTRYVKDLYEILVDLGLCNILIKIFKDEKIKS